MVAKMKLFTDKQQRPPTVAEPTKKTYDNKLQIRRAYKHDLDYLMQLDAQSYEYPALTEHWRSWEAAGYVVVAVKHSFPLAAAVIVPSPQVNYTQLVKLCVKPSLRRVGIGRNLLEHVIDPYLGFLGRSAKYITVIVPEYQIDPGSTDDVSMFLSKCEFKATNILKDHFLRYGERENAVRFIRKVPGYLENYLEKAS
jgi:GNAT superfamily N-acetyltransferase